MPSPLRTWLQLVRAPNLFTVPGDPLAGYILVALPGIAVQSISLPDDTLASYMRAVLAVWRAIAGLGPAVWFAIGASVCFYAAGLLDNDLADLAEDRRERPQRPLPSGAARPRTVAVVALGLTGLGLVLAAKLGGTALVIGAALVAAVGIYNHATKHLPVIGALNMGACRGLSLLLGAAAAPHSDLLWRLCASGRLNPLLTACALVTLYIAAITHLARFETKGQSPPSAQWLPVCVLVVGALLFLAQMRTASFLSSAAIFAIAVMHGLDAAQQLARTPPAPLPPVIGQLIRVLLLAQTAFCAAVGTVEASLAAAVLLIAWPISRAVSKRFYAS